ncbi:MAG TPA: transporter substrate-binding domain-containing protein [Geminicoccaceae bacterium]|nr:transporter substrate-binding domain-containing protein [Geminicoccaceae bacterium]
MPPPLARSVLAGSALARSALARSALAGLLAFGGAMVAATGAEVERQGDGGDTFVLPGPLPEDGGAPPVAGRYLEERYTDDLDALIARGAIRILVSYDRTNFFVVDGEQRGFEYDLLQQYRDYLQTRVKPRSWPVDFVFLPVPLSRLLPALVEGRGDIAAAGLTITPEREELAAFTDPYLSNVREVVVTSEAVEGLETLDDLSGRQVYVDGDTSFAEHLRELSAGLESRGLAPMQIVEADPKLVTEDILELVNAGVVGITVADDHVAHLWDEVLPDVVVRDDLAVHEGGRIAWAVRKENPDLLKSLNAAIADIARGTTVGNVLFKRYYENTEWLRNPVAPAEIDRLGDLRPLFEKYGGMYGFDWRFLAALAYQESRLDPQARSPTGAVGLMQVHPDTAADENVGIRDVTGVENNIHAGAKYLAHLRDTHFGDPAIDPTDRVDFALAAYHLGPSRVTELRQQAEREGLDPNRWFSNVEQIAWRSKNRGTADYITNIHKYHVAYSLAEGVAAARVEAVEALKGDQSRAAGVPE